MLHVAGAPAKQDHAMSAIKNFQAGVEVEPRRKLKILRTDCVGRFTSVEFGRYCAERGCTISSLPLILLNGMG
jgi:hypothetical protein